MNNIKVLIISLIAFFVVTSCNNEEQKNPARADIKFSKYISGYTSGVISGTSNIKIILETPLNTEEDFQLAKDLFSFSPKLKGSVALADDRTIVFKPEQQMPSDTEYEVIFKLNKVLQVPKGFETFTFGFKTIRQNYSIKMTGLKSYSNTDLKYQMLEGEVITADYVKDEALNNLLDVRQGNEKRNVSWTSTADGQNHYFTVDSILRTDKEEKISLDFLGKNAGLMRDEKKSFEIPPLSNFKVMDMQVVTTPEQQLVVRFSDPIKETQDIRGLVRFANNVETRLIISGNELKIFPAKVQTGTTDLIIDPALKNALGYKLGTEYLSTVVFEAPKPEVQFIGKGNIMPSSEGLTMPFKAVSLRGVNVRIIQIFERNVPQYLQVNQMGGDEQLKRVGRVVYEGEITLDKNPALTLTRWNNFKLDISEFIQTEPGAMYQVQLNFDRSQSLYACADEDTDAKESEEVDLFKEEVNDVDYWSWRGFDAYDYSDDYSWYERDNPCNKSYYMRYRRAVNKIVLASNLGVIAKQGETNQLRVYVNDIVSTNALSGVSVNVYNFQHKLIGMGKTNAQGEAEFQLDGKAFLIICVKDTDFGYLRVDDGSALSMSMFNVGGEESHKGISGFLYGERGVWRPGDSLFVALMLKDKNKVIPKGHPVVFEMTDPRGQLVDRKVVTYDLSEIIPFHTKTSADAPTGNYTLKAKLGGISFQKTLKIETVKPNRLKMTLDFDDKIVYSKNKGESGQLEVKWLHGTKGANLNADVEMTMAAYQNMFEEYPDFVFTDPSRKYYPSSKIIFDGEVNAQGIANVTPDYNMAANAPGMMKMIFKIRAFENAGDFSTTRKAELYSPYSHYVGVKIPKGEGWNGALRSDQQNEIPIVTLDEEGVKVNRKLKVELYKVNWRWWYENRHNRDLSRFVSSNHNNLVKEEVYITRNGKGSFSFNLNENYWGRMFLKITDVESGHSTGQVFHLDYPGWWEDRTDDSPGGATMLSFSLDKEQYETGDEVEVKIPSSANCRILVSVENDTDILHSEWIESSNEMSYYKFKVTPQMAPNAFVYVALVQPHAQTTNDRPIRLYGVQPLMVEHAASHLHPVIEMDDVLKPEEKVQISVSEKNGHPMWFTLAVVEDGLLDLTAFQTPDPWKHFFARKALGVKTWDMYDDVMGAFGGKFAALLKPGGGMNLDAGDNKNSANRFKPVVKFFGPYHLDKKGEKNITFTMPNYIGSVRTMVIASQEGTYGNAEKTTPVKKPLMTLATAPRVIRPGEVMDVPVTVFAMEDGINEVDITLTVNENLELMGDRQQTISFDEPGEKTVYYKVKANDQLGIGTLEVVAESRREKASHYIEMNVLTANPYATETVAKVLKAGETITLGYKTFGLKGTNQAELQISSLLPLDLKDRLNYLIRYPHGCAEQVTSSVFPQLYLENLMELSAGRKKEIQENVTAAITKLSKYQHANGGFNYWPNRDDTPHEWVTNYVGHFLLEAQRKGYYVPKEMMNSWLTYQQTTARNWSAYGVIPKHEHMKQAYRLYTMTLAGEPSAGDMNRLREQDRLNKTSAWLLAAAYTIDGKKKVAEHIIGRLSAEADTYDYPGYTYGSQLRDLAITLEALRLMGKEEMSVTLMREIAEKLSQRKWYSTQTTAFGIMTLARYVEGNSLNKELSFEYQINNGLSKAGITSQPITNVEINVEENPEGEVVLTNNGEGSLFLNLTTSGIPLKGEEKHIAENLEMRVEYKNLSGEIIDPGRILQGTDFVMEVYVEHPGILNNYEELVLTQILPAGWEIRNNRMDEDAVVENGCSQPDYQDIRDDRVYTYTDLNRYETIQFDVVLNATYTGRFYLPSVSCEAMYDNKIRAAVKGRWVEVYKAEE